MGDGDGTTRRDAALTLGVLAPVIAAAVVLDAPFSPTVVALGAGGAVAVELLLSIDPSRVRAVWNDRRIQATAVVVGVVGGVGLAVVAGPWVLTALSAGLCTYLGLLSGHVVWRRLRGRENH
jgi:hypothetical protein